MDDPYIRNYVGVLTTPMHSYMLHKEIFFLFLLKSVECSLDVCKDFESSKHHSIYQTITM